ncbi:hypothetical protein RWE15_25385 [Virgibacillus halophilus]|uniref:Uncharacterized protein n=1 Tax=Tigheibacillus halophilus TaxID=361280 RepID=A0ABU5CDV2_9BACI|nr:hypothetical protein [Virgibacillus halophilus]
MCRRESLISIQKNTLHHDHPLEKQKQIGKTKQVEKPAYQRRKENKPKHDADNSSRELQNSRSNKKSTRVKKGI